MLTEIKTIEELRQNFISSLINNSDGKVTKVSTFSVVYALSHALASLAQKIIKDIAQIEAKLFPQHATGDYLDEASVREGTIERLGSNSSSVVLLFRADSGTVYSEGFQCQTSDGIIFQTDSELTIGTNGYGFVSAQSVEAGASYNVDANSITILVSTEPTGHVSVTNPFMAVNGRDAEDDETFRNRILNLNNILSIDTTTFYEVLIRNINSDVMRVAVSKLNNVSDALNIIVVKNSGGEFTSLELTDMKDGIRDYVPFSDYSSSNQISNISYTDIDINASITLKSGYTLEDVAFEMQLNIYRYLDLVSWEFGQKVDWDVLLSYCRNTEGVKDIDDSVFLPHNDIQVSNSSLPRMRNFNLTNLKTSETIGSTDIVYSFSIEEDPIYKVIFG